MEKDKESRGGAGKGGSECGIHLRNRGVVNIIDADVLEGGVRKQTGASICEGKRPNGVVTEIDRDVGIPGTAAGIHGAHRTINPLTGS